ncbi:MAG: DUF3365 domain-containing protein [Nitrospirales bacterium]|nr:DUF3365 domain-containing protein [Nitrospirales bacterium]
MTRILGISSRFGILVLIVFIVELFPIASLEASDLQAMKNLSPAKVADFIHAIVEADRKIYTTHIVKRMQEQGIVLAREDWENKNAIPLPAQFLHISSKLVAESGHGIRFRLISRWPIYRRNGPATEFERKALEELERSPDVPQRGIVATGKKQLFQAIYADIAINTTCVTCHNTHPLSPKRDFKTGDLMGGIVVTIPLED